MEPLKGIPIDPATLGDLYGSADEDGNILVYHDGPLMWLHTLPSGKKAIVAWADSTEEGLTYRYHFYVYQPQHFDAVVKSLVNDNALLIPEFKKADEIYVVDWLMRKEDFRPLQAVQSQWDQLDPECLPTEDATLRWEE
jgi:hypothetical protein